MNILVSCMGYDAGKSGISSYMRNVAKHLKDCGHKITMLVEADAADDFSDFEKIIVPQRFSKSAAGFIYHIAALPFIASPKKYDSVLVLAGNRRFCVFNKIPALGVVHDLSQYRVGGKYDAPRMFYLTKIQPFMGRRFSRIAAISKSTRDDIVKYWKVAPEKIELNYNGRNPLAQPDNSVFEEFKLGKYILYVSRIEHPGKNHVRLIDAYEKLPKALRGEYKLVFVGQDWSGAEVVKARAANSPDAENIIFGGFLSAEKMAALYERASVFVMPSLSEGFGLPLIEAMSVNVPCACSETSSLGEIGEDAALLFDPESADEIKVAIERILTDKNLAEELSQKGKIRSGLFDWKKHAQTLLALAQSLYDRHAKLDIVDISFENRRVADMLEILKKDLDGGDGKTVAFINTHYLNTAYENPEQLRRLQKFDYVLPDGSGVSLACKIMGYPYRDNLNGTDLMLNLCELSEKHGYKLFYFGGREGVAERAVANLKKRFPQMKVAGIRNGYFSKNEEDGIIKQINESNADMLFVGFGAPLQEKWILENRPKLKAKLVFAIGGVVDVYSGDLSRNPILRKLGLEWLGRLVQDPVRLFPRYVIGNPLFVWRVIKYKFAKRKRRSSGLEDRPPR